MIRALKLIVVLVVAVAGLAPVPGRAEPVKLADVRISMSDGVDLVGDVRLPSAGGTYPVILVMSPYGREDQTSPGALTADYLSHGYAHVNVDIRGTGKSDGALCLFCDREQQDVYEVVEWIAVQPWSDGNVGMQGGSYLGISQLLGAAKQPPHLKAIVPDVPYTDTYRDIVWHNGIWNQQFMTLWTGLQAGLGFQGAAESRRLPDRAFNALALEFKNAPLDGPTYWERSVYTKFDRILVPTLLRSGWFDGFSRGTIRNFQGIAATHKRLIMGPSPHTPAGPPFDPLSPYAPVPPSPGAGDPALAWFDRFLKGIDNGIEHEAPVLYYDLGAFEWRSATTWPPPSSSMRTLHLSGERSGSIASLNDGTLADEAPTGAATYPSSYRSDPTVGVTEVNGKWGNVAAAPFVRHDQTADAMRQLTYTTPALTEPLRLAGPMELRFHGETDQSDTDWIVKVADVAPDGSSLLLTSGYLRASHRAVNDRRSLPADPWIENTTKLTVWPNDPTLFRIDIWPVAAELRPGHRLRIMISSTDVPNHEPLPHVSRNTVHHSARYPSELLLTVA
ncbi:MAG TPA: CocE/NonD family hydrolase [Actinomycetota bacterium]|nr:CocE/NonD family hydrolase [Actinomycetota bacterium]